MHEWRDGQEEVYNEVYKSRQLLARVYKTVCWAGYRHVPTMTIPSLDVVKRAEAKVLFKVGSYLSLAEEPCKFFDSMHQEITLVKYMSFNIK